MNLSEAVASRRSVRAFIDKPVDLATLRRVLEKAQMAPSGCNFQPWEATVLAGEPMRELQQKMLAAPFQDPEEYTVTPKDIPAEYMRRLKEIGGARGKAEGIEWSDAEARAESVRRNFVGFGATALLLCYLPRVMGPPQWSDVGMWLQTVMLLLREEGLDSCPQEYLSFHGRLIKDYIGVSDETHTLFCGMAIGYADTSAACNTYTRTRIPLDQAIQFRGFD
jgi:nitroreductase